jgi:Leucine-rich repeat (LRR) protein
MKRYLEFINESVVEKKIGINSEDDLHLIKEGVEKINASSANLTYLPELPESLVKLICYNNKLKSLPKLPENLENLYCYNNDLESLPKLPDGLEILICGGNKLKSLPKLSESLTYLDCVNNQLSSLPKLPEDLKYLYCRDNPLEYPIPHKFYTYQNKKWLDKFIIKLSSYKHQKQLIDKHGVYIMKKFENHPELINDKIKEENPTYFLSVEYGF